MTMGQMDNNNDSMMTTSQQEQQLTEAQPPMMMQRLCSLETVEGCVSPLRTDEEASSSSSQRPPACMSILDLKARKERLQQMIRDIEIRDEQVREQQLKLVQLSQQQQREASEMIVAAPSDHPMEATSAPAQEEEEKEEESTAPSEEDEESAPSAEDAESAPVQEALVATAEDEESAPAQESLVALAEEMLAPIEEEEESASADEECIPAVEDESEPAVVEEETTTAIVVDAVPKEETEAVVEASPTAAAAPVPLLAADDPEGEPPVSVESTTTTDSPQDDEPPQQQELQLLRPMKSAFRTGDGFVKPASPRRVFFDLSAVQVYQDFRTLPELPFTENDFEDNVHVDEDNNDDDDDNNNNNDMCEEVVDDDDDEEVWEEEVIEDDDVVHLAPPPPPQPFTVTPPTWEDRKRFVKKLHDLRDDYSIAEDNTSVTDDSTVSDLRSDTSFGSPTSSYRFEEQDQLQQPHSPLSTSPRRPLSPPCSRRLSLAPPLTQPLNPEVGGGRSSQERRMSMPSFVRKSNNKQTKAELPKPTVVSSPQALPSESSSYPTVSLSFLAQNITYSVAVNVMQEALRILQPGGILYVFDVEGAAVKKLPDELRERLVRVPYVGVKQTVHEIQTQEIMRNHGFVDLFPREDQIVRWMAVKPSAAYTVELA